jgi:PAS domain S-box-containing protein
MNTTSFIGLVYNAALLLALAIIFDTAVRWRTGQTLFRQLLVGLVLGGVGLALMLTPWTFASGVVFDARSVLLGISGLFFGAIPTLIAMGMTAGYRLYLGDEGAWTGVAIIVVSGTLGLAWRRFRRPILAEMSGRELYLFGVILHVIMLALMFTLLPRETALRVLATIILPVLIIYPLGTALLGILMANRLRRERTAAALRESETRYRALFDNMLNGFAYCQMLFEHGQPQDFIYLEVNETFEKLTGLKNVLGRRVTEVIPGIKETEPELFEIYGRVALTGRPERFEFNFRPLDQWLSISIYSPQKEYFVAVFENITGRKKAEAQIARTLAEVQQRAAETEAVLDAINDAVLIYDADMNLVRTNPGFMAAYGFDPVGLNVADIIERVARRWLDERPFRLEDQPTPCALRGEKVTGARFCIRLPGADADRIVEIAAAPLRVGERVLGSVTVWHDITEREQRLSQAQASADELRAVNEKLQQQAQELQASLEKLAAAQATAENERQRLAAVMEALPTGVAFTDAHGGIVQTNAAFAQIWGGRPTGINSVADYAPFQAWWVETGQPVAPHEWAAAQALAKGLPVAGQVLEVQRFDGGRTVVINGATPVRDANGQIVGSAVSIQDITTLKKAEAEIQHRASFPQANPDPVLEINRQGVVTYFNPATMARLERLGCPTDPHAFAPPDINTMTQKLALGEPSEYYREMRLGDAIFAEDIHLLPQFDAIRIYARDITAHKQAEEALHRTHQFLKLILDHIPQRIFWKDRACNYLGCNLAFARDAGLTEPAEIIGKNDSDLAWKEAAPGYQTDDRWVMETGLAKLDYEEPQNQADGRRLWLRTSKIPLKDSSGKIFGILGSKEDITAHKQAEALQQEMEVHMQVLQQIDHLRTELIGNVSHELRTPLGLILVMVTALHKEYIYTNPEMRDRILRDIEEEARKLQGIVDNLLDESRLQSGRLALNRRAVDVRSLIRKAVELQAIQAPQHRLSCQLPEAELLAAVDILRTEQILRNLLDNAVKYSPAGTAISVWAGVEADNLRIAVSDEGPGIPATERERIFERFYRVVQPQAPPVAGLGLGLSICRSIVEAHGGHLWAEERPGGGSTFVVTLPRGHDSTGPEYDRRRPNSDRRKPAARDGV